MTAGESHPAAHRDEEFCYLTTTGRRSGRAHEIEIWFAFSMAEADRTLYMMAGGRERADWVRNLLHDPAATIRIAGQTWPATARPVDPDTAEDTLARELLCAKYQGWHRGQPLSEWGRTALPIAFRL